MDHTEGLLPIGIFARLTRISVRMLRHYAEHGLLIPAWVDPGSGYRYYTAEQQQTARHIAALRDAAFPIAEMAAVLNAFDDPLAWSTSLQTHRHRLLKQQRQTAERLAALDRLTAHRKELTMTIPVHTSTLPPMTVAAVRDVIATYADEGLLWERLMSELGRQQLPPSGISGATFYDEDYQDTDVDVEVWAQVPQAFPATAPVECREVPEQSILSATLRGSYDQIGSVTAALGAHVAEHGLKVGPMFNIYRVSPAQDPDPTHWVTDVCLPVVNA